MPKYADTLFNKMLIGIIQPVKWMFSKLSCDLKVLRYSRTKSGNHRLVIKLSIGNFDLGIGVLRIEEIPHPKNTNPQFKITN